MRDRKETRVDIGGEKGRDIQRREGNKHIPLKMYMKI